MTWRTTVLNGSLDEVVRAEVHELVASCVEHDAAKPLSDAHLLAPQPTSSHVCVRDAQSGELVGYSVLDDSVAEGAVRPDCRRLGVGHALASEAIRLGADQAWAHANLPAAQRLAVAHRAAPVRRLLVLGVPASRIDPTPPQFPAGFGLRTYAGPSDDDALLDVNRAAFVDLPDQGSWSLDDLAARIAAPWFNAADLLLLVDHEEGRIVGFHWTKIHPSGVGEVYVVALSPRYHNLGLGTLLIRAGLVHLLSRDCPKVLLFVDANNTQARRAYDRLGFTVTREDILYRLTEAGSGKVGT